jgi:hypothetical protein
VVKAGKSVCGWRRWGGLGSEVVRSPSRASRGVERWMSPWGESGIGEVVGDINGRHLFGVSFFLLPSRVHVKREVGVKKCAEIE